MTQIQHSDPLWSSLRRAVDDPRPPAALVLGIAFAAQLGWVALVDAVSLPTGPGVVGIVIIAAVASWWLTAPAALLSAALAFLVADGFVLGTEGDLTWNGVPDAVLLVVTVLACVITSGTRSEVHLGTVEPASTSRKEPPAQRQGSVSAPSSARIAGLAHLDADVRRAGRDRS